MPSTPRDVKGLLLASIEDDNPVIFVEHKLLYKTKGEVPEGYYTIPLGRSEVKREGDDVTVVATSIMVPRALEAAERLAVDEGISAEVLDLRTLVPLDVAALTEPAACVLNSLELCAVGAGTSLAIVGAGPMGLLHLIMGRAVGAGPIIVSEPVAERREIARRWGADVVLDPATDDVVGAVKAATGGYGADAVVLSVGIASLVPGAIDLVRVERSTKIRDVNVLADDEHHLDAIVAAVRSVAGVEVVNVSDRVFLAHLGGKLEVRARSPLKTREDLSMVYTPGVARVSHAIAEDPDKVWNLTIKRNCVAIVSDGTAVLGLGDIGPEAALPVMEGKALLFKEFAGVDGFPICLDVHDVDGIVETVERGMIGERAHDDGADVAAGRIEGEHRREITHLAVLDHLGGSGRPLHAGGIEAVVAPFHIVG